MKKTIHSTVAGIMIQDAIFNHWWKSKKINIPFFENKKLEIIYVNTYKITKQFIEEADNALNFFLSLNTSTRILVSNIVHEHYTECIMNTNKDTSEIEDIWSLINPTYVYFEKEKSRNSEITITITCKCLWDDDINIQLMVAHNNLFTEISTQFENTNTPYTNQHQITRKQQSIKIIEASV